MAFSLRVPCPYLIPLYLVKVPMPPCARDSSPFIVTGVILLLCDPQISVLTAMASAGTAAPGPLFRGPINGSSMLKDRHSQHLILKWPLLVPWLVQEVMFLRTVFPLWI